MAHTLHSTAYGGGEVKLPRWIAPAPLDQVCKSEQMPNNPECLIVDSETTLDGSNGHVQIRKYPK